MKDTKKLNKRINKAIIAMREAHNNIKTIPNIEINEKGEPVAVELLSWPAWKVIDRREI